MQVLRGGGILFLNTGTICMSSEKAIFSLVFVMLYMACDSWRKAQPFVIDEDKLPQNVYGEEKRVK